MPPGLRGAPIGTAVASGGRVRASGVGGTTPEATVEHLMRICVPCIAAACGAGVSWRCLQAIVKDAVRG